MLQAPAAAPHGLHRDSSTTQVGTVSHVLVHLALTLTARQYAGSADKWPEDHSSDQQSFVRTPIMYLRTLSAKALNQGKEAITV
jgi:hypothetical protein